MLTVNVVCTSVSFFLAGVFACRGQESLSLLFVVLGGVSMWFLLRRAIQLGKGGDK